MLACIVIICMRFNPVVQWADRLYIGVEFRLSGCATGWLVIYRDRVQAVQLHNGLASFTLGQSSGCPVVQP